MNNARDVTMVNEAVRSWIQGTLAGRKVFDVEPLLGGTSSDMFLVYTAAADSDREQAPAPQQRPCEVPQGDTIAAKLALGMLAPGLSATGQTRVDVSVLRLYTNEEWRAEEPDLALHEQAALQRAGLSGLAVPRCLAVNPGGDICGVPALLMSHLPGRVDFGRAGLGERLEQLAAVALRIHRIDPAGFLWQYAPYQDLDTFTIPAWPQRPELFAEALAILQAWEPHADLTFIHRDFHPGNVLFQDNRLAGVVDWANACVGPPQVDVGQCRLDLVQLYGLAAADQFLASYREAALANFTYDPRWDLVCLFDGLFGPPKVDDGWRQLGVTHLTDKLVAQRLELFLEQALQRFHEDTNM